MAVLVALGLLFGVNFQWPDRTAAIFGILCPWPAGLLHFPPAGGTGDGRRRHLHLLPAICRATAHRPAHPARGPNGPSLVAFLLLRGLGGRYRRSLRGPRLGPPQAGAQAQPQKTWEGAIGSLAGSMLMAAGLWGLAELLEQWDSAILSYPGDIWYWLLLAVVVNAPAQVGDLAESALKRSAGVKDSGTCCPATAACWTASTPCCWQLRCCGTLRLFTSRSSEDIIEASRHSRFHRLHRPKHSLHRRAVS